MILRLVTLLLVLVFAPACGSRVGYDVVANQELSMGRLQGSAAVSRPSMDAQEGPATEVTPAGNTDAAKSAVPVTAPTPREPARTSSVPPVSVAAREERPSDYVQLAIDPSCVRTGDVVAATIATRPGAHLTLVVSYSDGRPYGQMGFAEAGADGTYVWRWVVAPTVPPGEALLFVAASGNAEQDGDWATKSFTVAGVEGCP